MPCLSLTAIIAITGWSLLAVSVSHRFLLPDYSPPNDDRDAPMENDDESRRLGRFGAARRSMTRQEPQEYDAVIVGAGWAGMKAAKTLLESGVSDVLVLEANGYVGGRSKSINQDGSINNPFVSDDNVPVDAGSEWLYDRNSMGNYLHEHLLARKAPIIDPKAYSGLVKGAIFYKRSKRKDGTLETRMVKNADGVKSKMWEGIHSFRRVRLMDLEGGDETWGDTLEAYKKKRNMGKEESEYIDLLDEVARIEYTCGADQLSLLQSNLLDQGIPTTRYMGMPGLGFGNVAGRYGEGLKSKIRLNSKVTEISQYRNKQDAIVKFSSNGRMAEVKAKTVLLTVSLGVLKANSIQFSPSLPKYKREVIEGMGFGVVNKCAMYWNRTEDMVWPDEYWFKLMGGDSEEESKWTTFFNPSSYKGTPMLTAWIGGDDAVEMERRTDDEVLDEYVMPNLEAMFPGVRRPDRAVVTRWAQEENVRGTYVYEVPHRDFRKDSDDLRKRVGKLWFAGEATTRSWHGTTVGAWETGRDAAQEMAKALGATREG